MRDFAATALVPTYNRGNLIGRCLDSILAQRLAPVQVLVVDDGSTDGTAAAVEPYGSRVEYCRQAHGGKASAVNAALARVRGDFLWVFDDDDVALPDALAAHARAFAAEPQIGWTYSSFYDGEDAPDGGLRIVAANPAPDFLPDRLFVELLLANFTKGHPGIVARTACYRQVGPLDETLLRSQDYELVLRLARRFRGAAVREFTYVKRRPRPGRGMAWLGPRRPSRAGAWKNYDRRFFTKLLAELPPAAYVPDAADPDRLAAAECRLFRVRRFAAAACHEVWERALEDLDAFAGLLRTGAGGPLTAEEARLLRLAMTPSYGAFDCFSDAHARSLRRIVADASSAPVLRELRRGLRASAVRSLRARRLRQAARKLSRLARLL